MFLYTVIQALVGIIAGIIIATRTKKSDGIVYGKLDTIGRITNIILIPVYAIISLPCMFLGMISSPKQDGILGILGWIVSIIIASEVLFCGLGLGASVALRKKGESKKSFLLQFAGAIAIVLTFVLYSVFAGNLLKPLN